MGVTCDTPLNTWTKHTWINHHTNDAIGERLDYIFFRETPEFSCTHVDVAVREQISGIGAANSGSKNYSDHFGVNAKFMIKPAVYHFENRAGALLSDPFSSSPAAPTTKSSAPGGVSVETLEEILLLLQQYSAMTLRQPKLELRVTVPLCIVAQIALIISNFFVETRWVAGILTVLVAALGAGWMSHFLYAFLYGRETEGTYKNLIDEVQESLGRRTGQKSTGSRTSSQHQATGARNSLLQ